MNPKTNEELVRKFEILNKKFFDGKIKAVVEFRERKSTRSLGVCSYNKQTKKCFIKINPLLKGKDMSETLLHEMCHAKNFIDFGVSSHGPMFKAECVKIYEKSNGKYRIDTHCTDEKLVQVLETYSKSRPKLTFKEKMMKKYNLTSEEYDKMLENCRK